MVDSLISVITPVYNAEKYLPQCIESVLGQSYKNIELLLIDDGSTDNGGLICDEYARKDDRIKVLHKKNGGAADSRNCGIDMAKGDYVAFVDADDAIHADFISILLGISVKMNADIVNTDFITFRDKYEEYNISESDIEEAEVLSEKHLYDDEFVKRETVRFTVPWGKICKKSIYDGIKYPVGRVNEDTHTTWRLMERANKVVYLKKPLYYWRENMESVTRSTFNLAQLSGLDAFLDQFDYFYAKKKQRYVELVYDQYMDWFFGAYNEMKALNMNFVTTLKPYYSELRKRHKYLKYSKSLGMKKWIKSWYLVYYKIPKILK